MTPHQIATNASAVRNLAGQLEALGFTGDAYAVAEKLAVNLLADGYKPVDAPVPVVGPSSTPEARQAALSAARAAVDAAKRKQSGKVHVGTETGDAA